MITFVQKDSESQGKFMLYEDDIFAGEITYSHAGESMLIIAHTAVEKAFAGKGYGKTLVMKVVDFARQNKFKILPLCPFSKKVFDTDNSISDVLFEQ
ncbi:MAG: GNAT family N-acetyltransferase [Chitinophagales bacterium]|nr:N-acetyltransferase [Bacteroidota bacterium]MCB9042285.1 N-acetyltransferase [Chitinophagales bacterium]